MDSKTRIKTWPAKDCAKSGIWRRPRNQRRSLYATLGAFLRVLCFGVVLTIVLFAVKLFVSHHLGRIIWDALSRFAIRHSPCLIWDALAPFPTQSLPPRIPSAAPR